MFNGEVSELNHLPDRNRVVTVIVTCGLTQSLNFFLGISNNIFLRSLNCFYTSS